MKRSPEKKQGVFILPGIIALLAGIPVSASATDGDIFAKGTKYFTLTYSNHPKVCGIPLDINISGTKNSEDEGTPLHAPEDGTVTIALKYKEPNNWGNAIYWTSNSGEKLFLAHLKKIDRTGTVKAGDKIGELGRTGGPWGVWGWNAHLHIERCNGQLQLSGTKIKANNTYASKGPIAGGPGGPSTPTEPPTSGKYPDFITSKVTLAKENGQGERYTWRVNETPYVHAWVDNIGKADWQGSADKIKVPFYLSKGTKEDSHSTWVRAGREEIKKKNIQVKDKPKEEKIAFNIPQWAAAGYIYPGRTYNFVVCADRPKDQDNGDGDVKEIHKSNNCSTPAVFYVDYGPARNVDVMPSNLILTGGKTTLEAGESYGLQADISNIGTESPWNGCRTSYEISGPSTGGAWQQVTNEGSTVAQLAPNATKVEVIDESRGLKAPSVAGDYKIRACVDYEQAIPETDETNNCTETSVTVTAPPPPAVTPRIVITNPNSDDDWRSDETDHDFRWDYYDFPEAGHVRIEYSLDGGATWLLVTDSTDNDGRKYWEDMCDYHTVDTHHAFVRITSVEYPDVYDLSDEFLIDHAKECK